MKAEKFKELFGCDEPIKSFEVGEFKNEWPVRILCEELYQVMIFEIERKQLMVNENSVKSIVDLVVENEDLKQSIFDLYLYVQEAKKGNKHVAKKCGSELMYSIFTEMMDNFEVIRDNFKQHKLK